MSEAWGKIKAWLLRSELWVTVLGILTTVQASNTFPEGSAGAAIISIAIIVASYVLGRAGVKMMKKTT